MVPDVIPLDAREAVVVVPREAEAREAVVVVPREADVADVPREAVAREDAAREAVISLALLIPVLAENDLSACAAA